MYDTLLASPLVQGLEGNQAARLQKAFLDLRCKSIDFFINSVSLHRQELLREDPDSGMGEKLYIGSLFEWCELSQRDITMVESSCRADPGPVTEVRVCQALRRMRPFLQGVHGLPSGVPPTSMTPLMDGG